MCSYQPQPQRDGHDMQACRPRCMPMPKGTRRPPCVCCLVGSFLFLFFKQKIKQVDLSCGCEGYLGTVGGSMLSGDLSLSLGSFVGPTVEGLAGLPAGDLGLLGIFASSHAGSLLLARGRPPQSSTGPSAQPRAHSFTAWWLGGCLIPFCPRHLRSRVPRNNPEQARVCTKYL